jgi:aspartate-semialdehyde dehydrogenase
MGKKVGYIGWRGMVGSVLMDRMEQEGDFLKFQNYFYSTSQQGQQSPEYANSHKTLLDANSVDDLYEMDILITCQGGDYTRPMRQKLDDIGWRGYWIDAASTKRMDEDSIIILDPINNMYIQDSLNSGCKNFIGGNCTVSLMLMALGGLFKHNAVEWISSMTYQAASGAGAKNMLELLHQSKCIGDNFESSLGERALDLEKKMNLLISSKDFPTSEFTKPLALNLLPWIDSEMDNGQTREEWKGQAETNKILQTKKNIAIDGTCVRVGALRTHCQAFTIKLNQNIGLKEIEQMIGSGNDWVKLVANNKQDTLDSLTPAAVSGSLSIPVGRLRKMNMGEQYLNAFSVGDQLLWGAAEPLRRMLLILNKA